jgi:dTDP-4-amino-4,6-dideoxygalactose transaminase
MIPVTKTYIPSLEDYRVHLEAIWQGGYLTNNGQLNQQLAGDIASFLGVANLELVANGTLALQLAIKALDLQDEIITTPYSYVATTGSILRETCAPD